MSNIEQTLSIIKPDAVERNLQEEIKSEFKKNNFSIIKEKKIHISKAEAEQFYKIHQTKPFYNDLCTYLSSGPIIVMILEKDNAVTENRKLSENVNKVSGKLSPEEGKRGVIISLLFNGIYFKILSSLRI